jgi:hypothetical protein
MSTVSVLSSRSILTGPYQAPRTCVEECVLLHGAPDPQSLTISFMEWPMHPARVLFCIALIATPACGSAERDASAAGAVGAAGEASSDAAPHMPTATDSGSAPAQPPAVDAGAAPGARMDAATGSANPLDAALSPEAGLRADARVALDASSDDDASVAADPSTATDAGAHAPPGHHFELPPATTARLETLVTPSQLGISERGAFIDDGRFFVLGGEGIYEIVGGPTG